MKRTLLIALLVSFSFGIYSQESDDLVFPTSDAIWNIQHYETESLGRFIEFRYGMSGDTIINDRVYNKIYLLNDTTLFIDKNDIYVGGIRQENKQVWFLVHDHDKGAIYSESEVYPEYLLCDFSKEIGETITFENVLSYDMLNSYLEGNYMLDPFTMKVLDIEEREYGKTFIVGYNNSLPSRYEWIEGIGSTAGLFWEYQNVILDFIARDSRLACFKLGDEVIYLNNKECKTCFYPGEGFAISKPDAATAFAYYNRTNGNINVSSEVYPVSFELINLQGQSVLIENVSSPLVNIPNNGQKGIYIYKIKQGNSIIQTGKLILE